MKVYKVLNPVIIKGAVHNRGEFIKVNATSVAAKYDVLEKTAFSLPTEPCYWCSRKGLPGNQFWLNYLGKYLCVACFAPESFPRDDISRVVYDTYKLEGVS